MSLRIEHLIKPFSLMSEEEQLKLIRDVRRNKFYVKPSMPKVKKEKAEQKEKARTTSKKKSAARDYLASLSLEERKALLAKLADDE